MRGNFLRGESFKGYLFSGLPPRANEVDSSGVKTHPSRSSRKSHSENPVQKSTQLHSFSAASRDNTVSCALNMLKHMLDDLGRYVLGNVNVTR